ncbi:MAG: YvcK family protein [Actinobacteria bacterium]|nr:YvcK family protein [Actinomycetota bacterium]
MVIALLAGGTGGATLAVGLRDALQASARSGDHGTDEEPAAELEVVANTGDDIEIYDVHVSPDPDLITFRLAGVIDERGFGIAGESHDEMNRRRAAGEDVWFELGDSDLAVCRMRAAAIASGATQSQAHAIATAAYPTGLARVLPMSDQPVRTVIDTPRGPRSLQEYMIRDRCEPAIQRVTFTGADDARPSAPVVQAIARADAIVIGPSNPVISIGPILSLPGLTDVLRSSGAPIVAVSPYVNGKVLKGPTAKFMAAAGARPGSNGVVDFYGDLVDLWIADEPLDGAESLIADVDMDGAAAQMRVAQTTLSAVARLIGSAA